MKNEQRPYSAILALTTLVLVTILISSTAMASPVGNSSSAGPYAFFSTNATSGFAPLSVQFNDSSQNATAWSWNFGEGSNSTERNPEHTYSEVGNYTVNLTVSNENGTNSTFASITVLEQPKAALPVANFSTNISNGYVPLTVQFTDLSENATTWNWSFGDGANSTIQNPVHTYSAAGNYNATLTINTITGTNTKSSYVLVSNSLKVPVAAFSAFPTLGNAPLNVTFIDESTNSPTLWSWYFGDGTNSTKQNPTHTYINPGQYYVSLGTSNKNGSGLLTKPNYITVLNSVNAPVAAFSASPASGSAPLNVSFVDNSIGSPTSWKWSFSDGTSTTDQNPVHAFSKPGFYTVTLTASNTGGSSSVTKLNYITVSNGLYGPAVNFSAFPTSGSAPLNVSFVDNSVGSPTSWKWSFGDGTSSTDQNPVHTFSKPGVYTVTLTAVNASGSNSLTKLSYITVPSNELSPDANFSAFPTSGNAPLKVSFTANSTGSPTSWQWYFGEYGTNTTDQNLVHTFSKPGVYTIILTAKNAGGSTSVTKSNYIYVSSTVNGPAANFSAFPTSGSEPLNVSFVDSSTGSPTLWSWNFGDGTNSTKQNPTHTYSSPGQYSVTLGTSNAAGSSSVTKSNYIYVSNSGNVPVAAFSAFPTSGSAPLNVSFVDNSTGSPTSWRWSFSDGTSTTSQNPVHTFSKPGFYTVTLTASNAGGSSSVTKSNYITVSNVINAPVVAFSASPTSGSVPFNVSFTDNSTGSPTSWKWYFGDGTSSTDQNPVHTFSTPGLYTVTLTAGNAGGSNSVIKSRYITASNSVNTPVATFSAFPTSGNTPLKVSFTDNSIGSPTSWKWSFGDGTSSTDRNPVHTFSTPGTYTVTMISSNPGGSSTQTLARYIIVK